MLNKLFFKEIDNAPLVAFRMLFGLLCFLESFGAILTGWVRRVLIEPEFTFSFIGFEWLQPLPGYGMYVYFGIMALLSLFVMLGYKYRLSVIGFTILWAGAYVMQKSSYNNHYYLLILISMIMAIMPAHRYASIDVKQRPEMMRLSMPNWCRLIIIAQLFIVYTYASVAKLYPDWLNGHVLGLLMENKSHYILIGDLLQQRWLHYLLAYGGIIFDGFIIPLLLYKPTRKWAFAVSIVFHLFNSIVFQIGIFPYLSLAFTLFFFEPDAIRRLWFKKKPLYQSNATSIPSHANVLKWVLSIYVLIQISLPLRHHFIEDDVLWTEEGHRMSWRMMLRTRSGATTFKVVNKETQKAMPIALDQFLTPKQQRSAATKPDIIWQFAQYLKSYYAEKGLDVAVYVDAQVSVNGRRFKPLIDLKTDLAEVEWQIVQHSDWILPSKQE